jgi:sulfoxide reductase heme-binding subunit YedZ
MRDATRWLKPCVFALCLVPFARLWILGFQGRLGANPVEFVTHSTGWWSLAFLCLTLTVTPLRRLTGWNVLARLRRMLGLYAFFYAFCHFITYAWFDQAFEVDEILKDVVKRPFITVGFAAFLFLIPLAATSTSRMMKRLGRRWTTLHRLIYPITVLGVLHFWWLKSGKNALAEPAIFALIVLLLLALRVLFAIRGRRAAATRSARSAG